MKVVIKHATAWAVTAFCVFALLTHLFFRFGAQLEAGVMTPLFSDVKGTVISVTADEAELLITGTKSRNCQLVAANVWVDVQGTWVHGDVKMLKPDRSVLPFVDQRIATNTNFVRVVRVRPAGSVKITLESRCHPLWVSYQKLNIITVNSGVAQR